MKISVLIMGLLVSTSLAAQQIVIGNAAAKEFVYNGKPVHPFCVGFPQEASSRPGPFLLSNCSDTKVVPKTHPDGTLEAEYPHEAGDFFLSFSPFVSYKVLAKKGDRFLIRSDSSGGGSGQFSNLFWVRFTKEEIGVSKDEIGGDRCIGGLSNYVQEGSRVIGFDVNTPAAEIISLTGVRIDKSITDQLKSGYVDCDGTAHYRYDLATEKMRLSSVKLKLPDPPEAAARQPQACFDRLVRQYNKNKKTVLNPSKLKKFGRTFTAMCALNVPR
jgi:hypothetical protein